ncbi:MAG: 50S ribosomal protein L4 [Pseudomonadota bacterium]
MKVLSDYKFNEEVFGSDVKESLLYDIVKFQLANGRVGTANCRNHALVSGTTAKSMRQKGSGRARHGDLRTNIFRGGGKSFGPKPRSYNQNPPKKMRRAALKSALSMKMKEEKVQIVDKIDLKELKTRHMKAELDKLSFNNGLIVVNESEYSLVSRCARNIPHIKVVRSNEINVYDLLLHDQVLFTAQSIENVQEGFKS